ncbi:hypothetical protein [Aurantiacibacter poecillastricola]|uniref:hypothetical protein n=1 Tax=Aurantiacibacter poecillastricola TaxID=3064385 RepID=UPI00273D9A5A|nr:hypothetical protein [Aurantiacibacter sp. 219JJ12-13]MDP5263129.1 hypothetical protein [Aurantiacibacter sp. 219JJ12-13]
MEKRKAAAAAAAARGTHAKLLALQDRSSEIVALYSARRDSASGADLARQLQFTAGVEAIRGDTAGEARKAERSSQASMAALRMAERRHELSDRNLAEQRRAEELQAEHREGAHLARKLKSRD